MDYKHEYDDGDGKDPHGRDVLRFAAALIVLAIPAWLVFNLVLGVLHLKGH